MSGINENPYVTLLLGALQCLILATLLVATPKGSPLRYAVLPWMVKVTGRFIHIDMNPNYAMRSVVSNIVVLNIQAARLLLINPVDNDALCHDLATRPNFFVRLYRALELLLCTRAVGTPWQVNNVPSLPAYYRRRGMGVPPRARFLTRELAILVWQYLFLDLLNTAMLSFPPEQGNVQSAAEGDVLGIDWGRAAGKSVSNSLGWFFVARAQIDFYDRLATAFLVLLGVYSPSAFRPFFGRIGDAYTLRGFWG